MQSRQNPKFHEENFHSLSLQLDQNDSKYKDLLQYLVKQYPPGSRRINLGSIYQIPIQAKGVELLMNYWYWNIEMINLTMHKIQNVGLQHLIQRNSTEFLTSHVNHQKWTNLTEIAIIKNNLTSQGFQGIQKIDLKNLKVLRASANKINHLAIYKFISSDWPNLVELEIANNQLGKEGCRLLMMSKWKNFKRLDLNYNLIENEGVHYLSQADWPELTELNLSNNKIDAQATFHLKNANWPKLKSLMLNKNQIGKVKQKYSNIGCQNLCVIKAISLEKLSLYGNEITLNGILMVLHSKKLALGCFLELSRNHFRFEDIRDTLKQLDRFCNEFQY